MTPLLYNVNQSSAVVYVAKICKADGTPIVQSEVASIEATLKSDSDTASFVVFATLTVQDSLVTTSNEQLWPYGDGYNFLHEIPASYLPSAETQYTLQYRFVLVGGSEFTTSPVVLQTGTSIV